MGSSYSSLRPPVPLWNGSVGPECFIYDGTARLGRARGSAEVAVFPWVTSVVSLVGRVAGMRVARLLLTLLASSRPMSIMTRCRRRVGGLVSAVVKIFSSSGAADASGASRSASVSPSPPRPFGRSWRTAGVDPAPGRPGPTWRYFLSAQAQVPDPQPGQQVTTAVSSASSTNTWRSREATGFSAPARSRSNRGVCPPV